MGSWGYRPQNSDQSLDLVYKVTNGANSALEALFNKEPPLDSHYKWAVVGALFHELLRGLPVERRLFAKAREFLISIMYDEKFIWTYTEPRLLTESVWLHLAIIDAYLQKNWIEGQIYVFDTFPAAYEKFLRRHTNRVKAAAEARRLNVSWKGALEGVTVKAVKPTWYQRMKFEVPLAACELVPVTKEAKKALRKRKGGR
jgi:hypothetical protein